MSVSMKQKARSILAEVAALAHEQGGGLPLEDLGRVTGTETERSNERWLATLRAEGAKLGVVVRLEARKVYVSGNVEALTDDVDDEETVSKQTLYRRSLRAIGVCTDCKEPTVAWGYCKKHFEKHRARIKRARKERIRRGLCVDCTRRAIKGKKKCPVHAEAAAMRSRAAYLARVRDRKCLCGEPARPGRVDCERCSNRKNERSNKRVEIFKAAGLCSKCGDRPPEEGYIKCTECREKCREQSLRSYYKRQKQILAKLAEKREEKRKASA